MEPSTRNCTPATATLSEAEALTVIVPETVAPDAGDVMLTVGGVVSGGGEDGPPLVTSKASTTIQADALDGFQVFVTVIFSA